MQKKYLSQDPKDIKTKTPKRRPEGTSRREHGAREWDFLSFTLVKAGHIIHSVIYELFLKSGRNLAEIIILNNIRPEMAFSGVQT